jgi:hypothetical protein
MKRSLSPESSRPHTSPLFAVTKAVGLKPTVEQAG